MVINRPRIALLGRFTTSANALRHEGVVSAKALLDAIWRAGGEPVTYLPREQSHWQQRGEDIHGVLLAGGGDINPQRYGQSAHESIYGVHDLQDEDDLALSRYSLERGIPTLAICRGLHIINVLRGGSLIQDLPDPHRNKIHEIEVEDFASFGFLQATIKASCFHHQAIDELGSGLLVKARGHDGVIEAVEIQANGWAKGVQWHPEDSAADDPNQAGLFRELVLASSR